MDIIPHNMSIWTYFKYTFLCRSSNNRIAILDTESGEQGNNLIRAERPGTTHYAMDNADIWTFIEGADVGLEAPSGIALVDGILFVTDNSTSEVVAFDLEGVEIDRLNTELESGSLMGIEARAADDLWLVDAKANLVYSLRPD